MSFCWNYFCFIENPVLLQPDRASMGETKPSSKNSFAASNAIDGDLNTYTAAEFNKMDKNHFYLWIHFGKTYLFVYMRCKLLNYQGFHLRIGVDEKLSGSKWLGYMGSNYCNYNARSFKTTYKMVKGRYARLSHPGNGASGEFRLAEIEFYGFWVKLNIHRYLIFSIFLNFSESGLLLEYCKHIEVRAS